VIDKNKLIEVQRTELVSDHIGGTAQKTLKAIKRAEGGVMSIDEAYRLFSSSNKDYGKEAIETVMSKMTPDPDGVSKLPVFIFAGYNDIKKGMDDFLCSLTSTDERVVSTSTMKESVKTAELGTITEFEVFFPEVVLNILGCEKARLSGP